MNEDQHASARDAPSVTGEIDSATVVERRMDHLARHGLVAQDWRDRQAPLLEAIRARSSSPVVEGRACAIGWCPRGEADP